MLNPTSLAIASVVLTTPTRKRVLKPLGHDGTTFAFLFVLTTPTRKRVLKLEIFDAPVSTGVAGLNDTDPQEGTETWMTPVGRFSRCRS